jgi:anaerobic ribonucleoside-triphosphate reductase activating protein
MTVDALFQRIVALRNTIEGITISGGEPLQQCRALLSLLRRVRRGTRLSVLVFSGYAWDEVRRMSDANALLDCIDVLIAGRYDQTQRLARDLRGSANKTVHLLTDRYTMDDLHSTPTAEVIITAEGDVVVSGIEPVRW